jgi:hypothetical protein
MKTHNITNSDVTYARKEIRFAYTKREDRSYEIHSDDPAFEQIIGTGGFTYPASGPTPYIKVGNRIQEYLTGPALVFADYLLRKIRTESKSSKMQ